MKHQKIFCMLAILGFTPCSVDHCLDKAHFNQFKFILVLSYFCRLWWWGWGILASNFRVKRFYIWLLTKTALLLSLFQLECSKHWEDFWHKIKRQEEPFIRFDISCLLPIDENDRWQRCHTFHNPSHKCFIKPKVPHLNLQKSFQIII